MSKGYVWGVRKLLAVRVDVNKLPKIGWTIEIHAVLDQKLDG